SIVSRNIDPLKSGVISICMFHAGEALNVIPATAQLQGTARSLAPEVRDLIERRVVEVAETTARLYGATAKATYERRYPVDRSPAPIRSTPTLPRGWAGRISPSCWRRGPAPSSSSATAARPACITPSTTSTTPPSPPASPTGRDSSRRRCRPEPAPSVAAHL